MLTLEKLKFWKRRQNDAHVQEILGVEQPAPPIDASITARRGLIALFVGLAVFLLWSSLAPLSRGVPVIGFVKVEGNRKTVQHLRGGIVEEIMVREGQTVKESQPLLRFNEVQTKAQLGIVENQLINAMAQEARLLAERGNKSAVEFPAYLAERKQNPIARDAMSVQRTLFQTRQAALKGEQTILLQAITGLEEQIRGLQAQEAAKAEQLRLFTAELTSLKPLFEKGFVPRNRMFELERAIAMLTGQRSEDVANLGRARSQIDELRLRIHQSNELFRKEVETLLADTQKQVADLRERLVALEDDMNRIVVRSPIAGVVVDLTVFTVGGVVSPGQRLMDVVPEVETTLIEVQIPVELIDNVVPGLDADVRFAAFDQFEVPHVPGKLVYVSADRLTDPRTNLPYFLGRVEVKEEGKKLLGKHKIVPGMPANVVIITGERSALSYFLHPILVRLQSAFTER